MRAHFFQHVPFEGLGSIGPWLEAAGYTLTCTRFYGSAELPDLNAIDALVVMGGPMSVNEGAAFPWLSAEKQFIREAIAAGIPVLGICLGAQLIASALGAAVTANAETEIGWFPVSGLAVDAPGAFRFPPTATVFHWHGETFALPSGAVRLATNAVCENQAFQYGDRVIGLQFHLEATADSVASMLRHEGDELLPSPTIQSEAAIRAVDAAGYAAQARLMEALLGFLFAPEPPRG